MPSNEPSPGSPHDWLRLADADLALAIHGGDAGFLRELLCFHAQQAAEKAFKSVLVAKGLAVPRTHNLGTLLHDLPTGILCPDVVASSTGLTEYAVASRYPGLHEPVLEDEYREAMAIAQAVVDWARQIVG